MLKIINRSILISLGLVLSLSTSAKDQSNLNIDRINKFNLDSTFLPLIQKRIPVDSVNPNQTQAQDPVRIETGPGPEDLVVQKTNQGNRILVSCCNRRPTRPSYGEILSYNPQADTVIPMLRIDEPEDFRLRPLGIFILKREGSDYLYVISNDDERNIHQIIRYQVYLDTLIFKEAYTNPLIHSPNAITVWPDGSFLVCNDAEKRGRKAEQILGLKRASIVFKDTENHYSVAASGLGMPAGMNHIDDQVFVSAATENRVYRFTLEDGRLINKTILSKVKGPDNIRIHDNQLLIACHVKTLRFIRHVNNPEVFSPTTLIALNPGTGDFNTIFYDSGELISAGSTGVFMDEHYYVGQIFEPWLVKIKNPGGVPGF